MQIRFIKIFIVTTINQVYIRRTKLCLSLDINLATCFGHVTGHHQALHKKIRRQNLHLLSVFHQGSDSSLVTFIFIVTLNTVIVVVVIVVALSIELLSVLSTILPLPSICFSLKTEQNSWRLKVFFPALFIEIACSALFPQAMVNTAMIVYFSVFRNILLCIIEHLLYSVERS